MDPFGAVEAGWAVPGMTVVRRRGSAGIGGFPGLDEGLGAGADPVPVFRRSMLGVEQGAAHADGIGSGMAEGGEGVGGDASGGHEGNLWEGSLEGAQMSGAELVGGEDLHEGGAETPGGEDFGGGHRAGHDGDLSVDTGPDDLGDHGRGDDEGGAGVEGPIQFVEGGDGSSADIAAGADPVAGESEEVIRTVGVHGDLEVDDAAVEGGGDEMLKLGGRKEAKDPDDGEWMEEGGIEGEVHGRDGKR